MRLIRIFPLSNLNTVILGRTMRGLSCTFPMTQRQDGFSILFLFNREGNATLSLYSSHILLYPTFHHLHHIYIRWAALARLIKKEQRWSKSPLAPPQCQCAKRVKIATVSTFLRSDRDEGSEAPKAGHCAGCCQKGPLSPWSSSGLIKFVLISFSFLSAHFCQKFLTDDFVLNEFLKWVSFCSAQVSCVVYLMKCLVINTVLVKFWGQIFVGSEKTEGEGFWQDPSNLQRNETIHESFGNWRPPKTDPSHGCNIRISTRMHPIQQSSE